MGNQKKRMANIELLRILAMFLVILLHYLGKGNLLPELTNSMDGMGYVSWFLEALAIVAVNVYVLISGYFLVESGFKCGRLIQLVCQILFYALLIPLCLGAVGILDFSQVTIYQWLQYVLPIQMTHYWFATAYVLLYMLSPFLSIAVHHMSKKQLQISLGLLLLLVSIGKTIVPARLEMDNVGYDAIWFCCVFLVAAYIRLYGIPFLEKKRSRGFFLYLAGVVGIFALTIVTHFIYLQYGILGYTLTVAYEYNHFLNLLAAVGLFYCFLQWEVKPGKIADFICKIAPYTFGVYLLHEHVEIRYLWPKWLGVSDISSIPFLIVSAIGSGLLVLAIGIVVDALRSKLFAAVAGVLGKTSLGRKISEWNILVKEK